MTRPRASLQPALVVALVVAALAAAMGCRAILPRQYEYDEQIELSLDGSATVFVNGSTQALARLHGIPLDTSSLAHIDRDVVRDFYTSDGVTLDQISTSRRDGRRFLHLRLKVADLRTLHQTRAFSWERIGLTKVGDEYVYTATIGPPPSPPAGAPPITWTGNEVVAFRLHLPARIRYHNAPSRQVERGNILEWEQSLADRINGVPIRIEARMDQDSILYSTLLLFGSMAALVAVTFAAILWWITRKPKKAA